MKDQSHYRHRQICIQHSTNCSLIFIADLSVNWQIFSNWNNIPLQLVNLRQQTDGVCTLMTDWQKN